MTLNGARFNDLGRSLLLPAIEAAKARLHEVAELVQLFGELNDGLGRLYISLFNWLLSGLDYLGSNYYFLFLFFFGFCLHWTLTFR